MGVICSDLRISRGGFHLSAHWTLAAGASLALIGPSGAGKSLFLGALAGFDQVTSGRISMAGTDVTDLAPADRPLTIMFQDHNLFPHLTVADNVALGIDPGLKRREATTEQVLAALGAVDLDGFAARYPSELSGGQQSRAALARALIRRRDVLLLDEPFSALGPGLRRQMLRLVERICREQRMTLIHVTHAPADAAEADLVSFVHDHQVAAPVAPEVLFAAPPAALKDYL